ncbi:zinc finger MYM-type protein 6 [Trichonephila clavipes]|nr:zinc finger MYM-type protein 6 [Trichonephila clavipes]
MDKFLSRKRTFDDNKASTSAQTSIVPKIKSRKYSQGYLNFGFTITEVNGEEKPLCVICSKILASDSMKPNKLKRHFETLHGEYINKPREFFESKLKSYEKQKTFFKKTLSVNEKALLTSYKVSYKIARCKKPHTSAEELILPAAIEIVETMFGENFAKELQSIPLSNDTVSHRIDDIAEDVEQQLFGKLRDKLFSIQLDEATDSNKDAHFIAYVRFWDGMSAVEELLFCKPIKLKATAIALFDILNNFINEANIEWKNCVGMCTDGARTIKLRMCVWVRDPFQNTPEGLSTTEEEIFTDFTSSGEIKRQFCNKTLFQFWAEVDDEFSELKTKACRILLPFSTSYLCETGFSAVAALKTKYRSQLNIEKELTSVNF